MIDSEFLAAMAAARADRAREGFLHAIRRQLDTVGDRGRDVQEAIELAPVYGLDLLQMRLLLFLCHNTMTGSSNRFFTSRSSRGCVLCRHRLVLTPDLGEGARTDDSYSRLASFWQLSHTELKRLLTPWCEGISAS